MATKTNPIPEGFHALTPHLMVRDAARAIDFYKAALGAVEVMRMPGPDGKGVSHAQLRVGGAPLFLAEEGPHSPMRSPESAGTTTVSVLVYVADADAAFEKAIAAGATVKAPLQNMFWGDRWGMVEDPFGHLWQIASHMQDLTPEQMAKRMQESTSGAR